MIGEKIKQYIKPYWMGRCRRSSCRDPHLLEIWLKNIFKHYYSREWSLFFINSSRDEQVESIFDLSQKIADLPISELKSYWEKKYLSDTYVVLRHC